MYSVAGIRKGEASNWAIAFFSVLKIEKYEAKPSSFIKSKAVFCDYSAFDHLLGNFLRTPLHGILHCTHTVNASTKYIMSSASRNC